MVVVLTASKVGSLLLLYSNYGAINRCSFALSPVLDAVNKQPIQIFAGRVVPSPSGRKMIQNQSMSGSCWFEVYLSIRGLIGSSSFMFFYLSQYEGAI